MINKKIHTSNPFQKSKFEHFKLAWKYINGKHLKMLDYGCGTGRFIGPVSEVAYKAYGFDVDNNKIRKAADLYKHVTFASSKIGEKLPYKNKYFDLVSIFHVLEHVDSEENAIGEIYRILKKGGYLLIASPYKGIFSWADMANLRYLSPFLHKVLGRIYYGGEKYKRLFNSKKKSNLYGDSSVNRKWHKHYKSTEINSLLKNKFKITLFKRYSLFQPFLLTLSNLWVLLFRKENDFINKLILIDNKINAGDNAYNFFLVAIRI